MSKIWRFQLFYIILPKFSKIMELQEIFAQRLKNARIRCGFSSRDLAGAINYKVSAETLRNYENGKSFPNSEVMEELLSALNVKIDDLFRPFSIDWNEVNFNFRKRKSISKNLEGAILQQIKDDAEHYIELEETFSLRPTVIELIAYTRRNMVVNASMARIVAQGVRKYLHISEEPIVSLQDMVERCGIKLLPISVPAKMDGVNFECNGHVFICYNTCSDNVERRRFTIAHELGHLLLNIPQTQIENEERLCDAFASELILPGNKLKQMLGENRHNISLQELKQIQSLFGISVDAIMYAAKSHNIITENRFKTYFMIKRGNESLAKDIDRSEFQEDDKNRYTALVYRALSSERITVAKAAYFLNTSIQEVSNNLKLV